MVQINCTNYKVVSQVSGLTLDQYVKCKSRTAAEARLQDHPAEVLKPSNKIFLWGVPRLDKNHGLSIPCNEHQEECWLVVRRQLTHARACWQNELSCTRLSWRSWSTRPIAIGTNIITGNTSQTTPTQSRILDTSSTNSGIDWVFRRLACVNFVVSYLYYVRVDCFLVFIDTVRSFYVIIVARFIFLYPNFRCIQLVFSDKLPK